MKRRILLMLLDFSVAAAIVMVMWIVEYRFPHGGVKVEEHPQTHGILLETAQEISALEDVGQYGETDAVQGTLQGELAGDTAQNDLAGETAVDFTQDWRRKFADKFSDETIVTDTSYSSPNLAVQLSYHNYDSGILDRSASGKHKKYGTRISYVIADIYVGDITCFQTVFAQNTYGVGYSEKLSDISERMRAVLAVNGDSYSNNRHKDNGTIIRNGVVYRNEPTDSETCVLNWDGTMDIYEPGQIDLQQLADKGAYQSWIFGPSLLDGEGKAKGRFLTWNYIRQSHPRTAIGYYEPGHYCLLLADGRQKSTRGMFLDEMARVFEELGCKAAYNLDGGHCSFMTFQGRVANHPYKPEHEVTDGIILTENWEGL